MDKVIKIDTFPLSIEQLARIRLAAEALLEEVLESELAPFPSVGVCGNLSRYINNFEELDEHDPYGDIGYRLVSIIAASWRYTWSPGERCLFPILDVITNGNNRHYKWEGENRKKRINLLEYIIARLYRAQDEAEKYGKAEII